MDSEWLDLPLRCPQCGNRAKGIGGFWIQTTARLDHRGRPTALLAPDYDQAQIDCARCDYQGPVPFFLPPWIADCENPYGCSDPFCAEPLLLTSADRAEGAAWLVDQAEDGLRWQRESEV